MFWRKIKMIFVFSVIALICSIVGNSLVNLKNKWGYPVWIVSNVFWIAVNFIDHLNVPQVLMYLIYSALNVWGFIAWSKKDKKSNNQKQG